MVKKKKQENTLKTYIFYIKDPKKNKIFLDMTKISKNVYNSSLYIYKIYKIYKSSIFEDLYNEIKKIKNKIKKEEIDMKSVEKFHEIFNKYYKAHSEKKKEINELNDKLFKKIKNKIEKKKYVITNINYEQFIDAFITYCKKKYDTKKININYMVTNIIRSFYVKNYFYIKSLVDNNKLTEENKIKYKDLISFVENKSGVFDFDDKNDSFKEKITKELNVKLTSVQNMLSRIIYKNLGENFKKLPSDVIINIINKVFDGINSNYMLLKSRKQTKTNFLKFKEKDEMYNLFYFERSFKILDDGIRLNVGDFINKNYNKITGSSLETIMVSKTRYNYNKKDLIKTIKGKNKKKFIKIGNEFIPKKKLISSNYLYISKNIKLKDKKIKLIELKPENNKIKVCIVYENIREIFNEEEFNKLSNNEKINKSISIDLGIKNLMTIYNPTGDQYIIKGGHIISINNFYKKKINNLKSINKKKYNKNKFNRLSDLFKERNNKIKGYFNKVVDKLIDTYNDKEQIIVGYNSGWKTNTHMGKKNNEIFYSIPFSMLLNKLILKAKENQKNVVITKESYTSKCDSLNLEKICYHEKYDGNRNKRGLFSSKKRKLINADLNGAINIMRKKINLTEINGNNIFNPKILNL